MVNNIMRGDSGNVTDTYTDISVNVDALVQIPENSEYSIRQEVIDEAVDRAVDYILENCDE